MSKNNRTRRDRTATTLPIYALPFVAPREQGRANHWNVPATGGTFRDLVEAESTGRHYAALYKQWLQANPELVGMGSLGWIASDIDFKDPARTGYWIGFFSCIERLVINAESIS